MEDRKNLTHSRGRLHSALPLLLSLLLPFLIGGAIFLYEHLTEPGVNMKVVGDGLLQYFPFLRDYRDKLLGGNISDYSQTVGMGSGYASLYAYYLASPLALFVPLVPLDLLPHYYTLMILVKISFAGLFMAWFLRIVYRKNDFSLPFFGLIYAFCAWSSGYYWNIMWLDVFALLPLLVAGTVSLLKEGRFRLYILTLAAALWINYYIAFFCCIFVLLCFIGYCICTWTDIKNFLRLLARIAICTAIAVGIACIVLIPTLLAMQNTYAAAAEEHHLLSLNIAEGASGNSAAHGGAFSMLLHETIPCIVRASRRICNEMLTGNTSVTLTGLPNVFSGLSTVILAIYFVCYEKISKRERIVSTSLLAFIFLSFIFRSLDYVWHGFHFTNMLPYRFSFLFSFVLVAMAFRAYTLIGELKAKHLLFILPVPVLLILNAYIQNDAGSQQLSLSVLVTVGMGVWFLLNLDWKRGPAWFMRHRKLIAIVLLMLMITCEMSLNFRNGSKEVGLNPLYRNGQLVYPQLHDEFETLKAKTDDGYYRTETTGPVYVNDAAMHGYNGVSAFTSSANVSTNRILAAFGLSSRPSENTYTYFEASPLTNTMLGIRYLFDRNGLLRNTDYNQAVASAGQLLLMENQSFISMGFMTDSALQDFVSKADETDTVAQQEELFRLATGSTDALYTHYTCSDFVTPENVSIASSDSAKYDYISGKGENPQFIAIRFTVEDEGLYLYATEKPLDGHRFVEVYCNGQQFHTREITARGLFSLGNFQKGDELVFKFGVAPNSEGQIRFDLVRQNNAVYDAGLSKLADEPLIVEDFSDGYVKGTVSAKKDGLFYTCIPYEPGWTAYVDGKEVPIAQTYDPLNPTVKLTDAFICFPLSEGDHTVELTYTAPGSCAGAVISAVSLMAFIALWIVLRKKPIFFI